jgi:hypothetical protein
VITPAALLFNAVATCKTQANLNDAIGPKRYPRLIYHQHCNWQYRDCFNE